MDSFRIGDRQIGSCRAFIICEVAQAHDGSLGLAHAFIEAAAAAGADAIKFQTHIAAAESTLDEIFRVKFSQQDATRYDYWRRMEFTPEQWAGLAAHARDKKLVFLSSAFSIEAVDLLRKLEMPAWKVASGELGSDALLEAMLSVGLPFIVSSGMSPWTEIDAIVSRIRDRDCAFAVLQCTSRYPTALEAVGLNVIGEMRKRYGCPVGLSDHSGRPEAAIAAIARGADVIEIHLTLDRGMFGPDVSSSLTIPEFKSVCAFRDALAVMDANPVDKDKVAQELAPMRAMFGRSLSPRKPMAAGAILSADMLSAKKPGTGIPERELPRLIGRKLKAAVTPERLLRWEDIEAEEKDKD
jgi:N,N'-diacetyllegionaminate synthase